VGFPIRKFPDQSLFAAPRDLSQRTTSFIASQRQGIHRTPLRHLIALIANARRSQRATADNLSIAVASPFQFDSAVYGTRPSTRMTSTRDQTRCDRGFALDFSKRPFCFKRIREP
jgi:hypothetical protein